MDILSVNYSMIINHLLAGILLVTRSGISISKDQYIYQSIFINYKYNDYIHSMDQSLVYL